LLGIAGLFVGLLIFLVGHVVGINNLRLASLPVVLGSLVLLNFGLAHLRVVAVPLALLFLTGRAPAPLITAISLPLQLLAAKVATGCLATLGIPVLREGNVIVLARTSLEVAEACSGLRSFEALLIMSGILAYLSRSSVWKGAALVLLSVPIAVVVNVGRVTITGIMAQYFGRRAAEGFYHSFTGWLAFVVAMGLLFLVSRLMARRPARPAAGTTAADHGDPQVSA
jgi:exosortase